jgi:hypothetical protein
MNQTLEVIKNIYKKQICNDDEALDIHTKTIILSKGVSKAEPYQRQQSESQALQAPRQDFIENIGEYGRY